MLNQMHIAARAVTQTAMRIVRRAMMPNVTELSQTRQFDVGIFRDAPERLASATSLGGWLISFRNRIEPLPRRSVPLLLPSRCRSPNRLRPLGPPLTHTRRGFSIFRRKE